MSSEKQPIVLEFTVIAAKATDLDAAAQVIADDGLNGQPYALDRMSTATAETVEVPQTGGYRPVLVQSWSADYQATEVLEEQR